MARTPPVLRRAALAFGLALALSAAGLFLLVRSDDPAPRLASDGGAHSAAAWTPAPLLALLIVASMSALVLLVTLQPRRG